jgi:WD40 repeat protein
VWDKNGNLVQTLTGHTESVMDADWKNNKELATCSGDKTILLWRLGEDKPIKEFRGHTVTFPK